MHMLGDCFQSPLKDKGDHHYAVSLIAQIADSRPAAPAVEACVSNMKSDI